METTTQEVQRIDEQIERAFREHAWSGPSVLETLEGVTAKAAAARPIADAHTIWEITLHIGVWKSVVTRRLGGDPVSDVPPEEDWPAVTDTSEMAWKAAREDLEATHGALRRALAQVTDETLDLSPAKGYASTRYVLLHGVIQHDLYHAGQIAVLKKG